MVRCFRTEGGREGERERTEEQKCEFAGRCLQVDAVVDMTSFTRQTRWKGLEARRKGGKLPPPRPQALPALLTDLCCQR